MARLSAQEMIAKLNDDTQTTALQFPELPTPIMRALNAFQESEDARTQAELARLGIRATVTTSRADALARLLTLAGFEPQAGAFLQSEGPRSEAAPAVDAEPTSVKTKVKAG